MKKCQAKTMPNAIGAQPALMAKKPRFQTDASRDWQLCGLSVL
jgi:hypothetical protein